MTLAGALEPGSLVRLMHADNQRLIDGAKLAAEQVRETSGAGAAVLLISCVGRRNVLGDDIDDEIEAVRAVFPAGPHGDYSVSELHNQSMTIASFCEIPLEN